MLSFLKKRKPIDDRLYNKILSLSRNKIFYIDFGLSDTFQNRIHLMFLHISFLNIKIKQTNNYNSYQDFFQETFELMFKRIEQNMREIGYGDVTVNKKMKILITTFYNILLKSENYYENTEIYKMTLFSDYLECNNKNKSEINPLLIQYFDKYAVFCLDLSLDNVIKGEFNFKY